MKKRSQIYLSLEQWRLLGALSHQMREPVSELIRRAIDRVYGGGQQPDFAQALRRAAGLWEGRRDLPRTRAYLRGLRRDSRLKRLYGPKHA